MKRLITATGLKIDDDELNYLVDCLENGLKERTAALIDQAGITALNVTKCTEAQHLKVIEGATAGYIKVSPGEAILSDGERIFLQGYSAEHEVPADDTAYNVIISYDSYDDTAGTFEPGYPQGGEPSETRRHDSYEIEITKDDADSDEILLATVTRDSGTDELTIVDRRSESLLSCRMPILASLDEVGYGQNLIKNGSARIPRFWDTDFAANWSGTYTRTADALAPFGGYALRVQNDELVTQDFKAERWYHLKGKTVTIVIAARTGNAAKTQGWAFLSTGVYVPTFEMTGLSDTEYKLYAFQAQVPPGATSFNLNFYSNGLMNGDTYYTMIGMFEGELAQQFVEHPSDLCVERIMLPIALFSGDETTTSATYELLDYLFYWEPLKYANIRAIYFEALMKAGASNPVYAELYNVTDTQSITGSELVESGESAYDRNRTADIKENMMPPYTICELGVRIHVNTGSDGAGHVKAAYLILEMNSSKDLP